MEPHGQEVEGAKGIGFKLGKKQQSNSKVFVYFQKNQNFEK